MDLHARRAARCLFAFVPSLCAAQEYATTERASTAFGGGSASMHSSGGALSDDGRYVAFSSRSAVFLAPGLDTNQMSDVFVLDRATRVTTRVSVGANGIEASSHSYSPSLSADGACVAFTSDAPNLVATDNNGLPDVFRFDRATQTVSIVSVGPLGLLGNGPSHMPEISADGRYVVFESFASNLDGVDLNSDSDVFWHDTQTQTTRLVSVALGGQSGSSGSGGSLGDSPSVSADGRYVAFQSYAPDLVPGDTNGPSGPMPSLLDGQDAFVRDMLAGTTVRVSVSSSGAQADYFSENPSLSGDGRFVVFTSRASNLVALDSNGVDDVFLHDRDADGDGLFDEPGAISTEIVSLGNGGLQANSFSGTASIGWRGPCISRDGARVAFQSLASNLVPGDTNSKYDVFVRDLALGRTWCVSALDPQHFGNLLSHSAALSADGSVAVFTSDATNLVLADANNKSDVFARVERTVPSTYCAGLANSQGCVPTLDYTGVASPTSPLGFQLHVDHALPNKLGALCHASTGPVLTPIDGSLACFSAPFSLGPKRLSTAVGGAACSGRFDFDFTAYLGTAFAPLGTQVWLQVWSRDGASPLGLSLSDVLQVEILP